MHTQSHEILFPEGAGGLPTLKLGVLFSGKIEGDANGTYLLDYRDGNFPGRAGWKEIVAVATDGAKLSNSSVPEQDRSAQLSNYPTDLLNSPPQVLAARIEFTPAPAPLSVAESAPAPRAPNAVL